MEFEGRVAKLLPMRSGIGARTGNPWKSLPFVFEYFENPTDRYADSVLLETFDDKVIDHMKEGMEVRCGFCHRTKTFTKQDGTESTFNDIRLYKIESIRKAKKDSAENAEVETKHTGTECGTEQNEENDDLPF